MEAGYNNPGPQGSSDQGSSFVQKVKTEGKKAVDAVTDSLESGKGVEPHQPEGTITKQIENITSQIPSGTFLTVAVGAIGASLFCQLIGKKEDAQFIGQWVPTVLLMGLYNKLVKLQGSE